MFIYHFSRLIKSKLLWGFLALLMVFAFVVMDSCSGADIASNASGYIDGEGVDGKVAADASQTATMLNGPAAYYLPMQARIFGAAVRDVDRSDDWSARARQNWKIIAARTVADRNGLCAGERAGVAVLERTFVDQNGVFNPSFYRNFLAQNNYADASSKLFEKTFSNVWLPAQVMTATVMNSVGWVSPMELDFVLNAGYDTTTAYAATLPNQSDLAKIDVTDAQLKNWYDTHTKEYKVPEARTIAYVEVPLKGFADKVKVEDFDAMQYHEDHPEEFRGTGTNATKTLPFEEVKDKAIAAVRNAKALEQAMIFANETLVPQVVTSSLEKVAKPYGAVKTFEARQDRPFGLQKASDVVAAAFEMDLEETPVNAVAGTDRVYLFRLTKVTPEHIAPLAEVRNRVLASVRRDMLSKRLKANGQALRDLLTKKLAAESDFAKAVAACKTEGLTASTAMTFVVNDAATLDISNRTEIIQAASQLGVKGLSDPIVMPDDTLLLVYVADRKPGDPLAKTTAKSNVAESLSFASSLRMTTDWLNWNLDRNPPTTDAAGEIPLLREDAIEE